MVALPISEQPIQLEEYRVSDNSALLLAVLSGSLVICMHDDTQGAGGVLHLPYATVHEGKAADLTDNILSANLLLLDRFCKAMRGVGARKSSWRVRIVGHVPRQFGMEAPAADVFDLLKAYFADTRLPVEVKEIKRDKDVLLRFDSHNGKIVVTDASPMPA